VFYAPPEHGPFYPDLLNLMEDTGRALTGPGGQPQESQSSLAHHSTVSQKSEQTNHKKRQKIALMGTAKRCCAGIHGVGDGGLGARIF